jgi:hypothetical protein
LAVVCTDQLLPFQPSASVPVTFAVFVSYPIAVHADVELQETPVSALNVELGFEVVWRAKLLPFQPSARV